MNRKEKLNSTRAEKRRRKLKVRQRYSQIHEMQSASRGLNIESPRQRRELEHYLDPQNQLYEYSMWKRKIPLVLQGSRLRVRLVKNVVQTVFFKLLF